MGTPSSFKNVPWVNEQKHKSTYKWWWTVKYCMWNKHKARANAQTSHCQNKNGHGHKVWQQLSYRSHLHIWENDNMKVLFLTVLFFGCLFLVLFLSFIFWRGSVLLLFCLFVCLFLNFGQRQEMQKHLPWTEKLLLCHCICTYSTKSTWLKLNCIRLPPPQKKTTFSFIFPLPVTAEVQSRSLKKCSGVTMAV